MIRLRTSRLRVKLRRARGYRGQANAECRNQRGPRITPIGTQEFLLALAKLGRRGDTGPSDWRTFWQCEPLFLIRVNSRDSRALFVARIGRSSIASTEELISVIFVSFVVKDE